MIDLFQSRFSPECSNRREDEEQIWMYWVNFIERIDGKSYIKPRVEVNYFELFKLIMVNWS